MNSQTAPPHRQPADGGLSKSALFAVGDRVRYVTSEGIVTRIVHGNRYRVLWESGTYAGKERYHDGHDIHSANNPLGRARFQ